MAFIPYFIKKVAKNALNFGNYFLFLFSSKKLFQKKKIQKILLINLQGIGDIVMTTPLLTALYKEYPQAQIDYLCAKENGVVFLSDFRVHQVISRKKDDLSSFDFLHALFQVRSKKYDLVLNLFAAPHSALLTLFSDALYIAGPLYSNSSVCNWSYQKTESTWDVRLQSQHLASLLDISLKNPYALSLVVDSKQKKNILKKLNRRKKYILFNTAAQWKAKQWPLLYWQQLIFQILSDKKYSLCQLAFLGVGSDFLYVEKIISAFENDSRLENWCGKWTLAELPAVLQHASLFITTDSGPMHIASAVQTKTIGLFGVTDANILVSRNPFIIPVSSYDSCPKKYHFNHHTEPYDPEQVCMSKISALDVFSKVENSIKKYKNLKKVL